MSRHLSKFPLFQSHLDLAHYYWQTHLIKGDHIIDATCGNGYDTLFLAQHLYHSSNTGSLHAFDKQAEAVESTTKRLNENFSRDVMKNIYFYNQCHSAFPSCIEKESISLIVYNLGYLPGGDKKITTERKTTLQSVVQALTLIKKGGLISITCYPGHTEGKREEDNILQFCATLPPKEWSCCYHEWKNRNNSPSLLLIQRAID